MILFKANCNKCGKWYEKYLPDIQEVCRSHAMFSRCECGGNVEIVIINDVFEVEACS